MIKKIPDPFNLPTGSRTGATRGDPDHGNAGDFGFKVGGNSKGEHCNQTVMRSLFLLDFLQSLFYKRSIIRISRHEQCREGGNSYLRLRANLS